jgi:SAM-dependent methyltransferase
MADFYLDSLSLREEMPRLANQSRLIYLGLAEFLNRNSKFIKPNASILDLGCGPGILTALIAKNFPKSKVTGVDRCTDMVKFAQVSHPDMEWIQCESGKIPFPDQTFQVIQHSYFLIHVPELDSIFSEIHRLLAPQGLILIIEPNPSKNTVDPKIQTLMKNYADLHKLREDSIEKVEDFYCKKNYSLLASEDLFLSATGSDDGPVLEYPRIKIGRMSAWSLLSHMGQLINLRDVYGECLELYMAKKCNIQELCISVRLYQKNS